MVEDISLDIETIKNWVNTLCYVNEETPFLKNRVKNSMTKSQCQSKIWLINELKNVNIKVRNVALLGGWYAQILTPLLVKNFDTQIIVNYELDYHTKSISYKFNKHFKDTNKYLFKEKNVMFESLNRKYSFDTVINTSCEHMYYMNHFRKINSLDSYFVLQSTDDNSYVDHINCVKDEEELIDQSGIVEVLYKGKLNLDNGMTRFMVIGK